MFQLIHHQSYIIHILLITYQSTLYSSQQQVQRQKIINKKQQKLKIIFGTLNPNVTNLQYSTSNNIKSNDQTSQNYYLTLSQNYKYQSLLSFESFIIKLILPTNMLTSNTLNHQQAKQTYGFLCQKTNVFYAFDSYNTYSQFLHWLERQNIFSERQRIRQKSQVMEGISDQQRLADCEMVNQEIMQVFDDPRFKMQEKEMQMQEIDF